MFNRVVEYGMSCWQGHNRIVRNTINFPENIGLLNYLNCVKHGTVDISFN